MNIGFVGVGFMGRHMARNVLNGGHAMKVYDLTPDAADELISLGATWAGSPREAAEGSDVIFTSLPTPQVVEEVASGEGGVLSGARRGSAYFDLSTTDPATIQRIAARAESSGVHVLDAPVSGGTPGAEAGTLCVMVGGDRATYDLYKPVLDLIGDKVMYCGGLGSGAVSKIVNNPHRTQRRRAALGSVHARCQVGCGRADAVRGGIAELRQHHFHARLPQRHLPAQIRAGVPASSVSM